MASTSSKPDEPTPFQTIHTSLLTSALKLTKQSASLPPESDLSFHRTLDPEFAAELTGLEGRVLSLVSRLVGYVAKDDKNGKGKERERVVVPPLDGVEDLVDRFDSVVVDGVDGLLECADTCLDEYLGRTKKPAIAINPPASALKKTKLPTTTQRTPQLSTTAVPGKPQTQFLRRVDNADKPWYPNLLHKYNAKVPLGYVLRDEGQNADADAEMDDGRLVSTHPYHYELTHITYPSHLYKERTPTPPHPLTPCTSSPSSNQSSTSTSTNTNTHFTYVSTAAAYHTMIRTILASKPKEIAIDLEHHDYRTYAGFVCLMQISTREADWVVDCLVPEVRALMDNTAPRVIGGRGEDKGEGEGEGEGGLASILSDPGIVKVFHGAESDIVWLQQDFGLYVVGLFDTFHASKLLEFPRHGLANLLEMYCDFIPDKKYQLADWRMRPLPQQMLEYARSDTHFLLFIYDNLVNALIDRQRSIDARSRSASPTTSNPNPTSTNPTPSNVTKSKSKKSPSPRPGASSPHSQGTLLAQVLTRSTETALRTYSCDAYDYAGGSGPTGWDTLAKKWGKIGLCAPVGYDLASGDGAGILHTGIHVANELDLEREVYRGVHRWRDRVAREEDESLRFILANHHLFTIASKRPTDEASLLRVISGGGGGGGGGGGASSVVRKRAGECVGIVKGAIERFELQTAKSTKETVGSERGGPRDCVQGGDGGKGGMEVDGGEEMITLASSSSSAPVQAQNAQTMSGAAESMSEATSSLWSSTSAGLRGPSTSASGRASSSSLFRPRDAPRLVPEETQSSAQAAAGTLATRKSSLFGDTITPSPSSTSSSTFITLKSNPTSHLSPKPEFSSILARIHKSLVIAPKAPVLPSHPSSSHSHQIPPVADADADAAMPVDEMNGMQVEIPYVPASQRVTLNGVRGSGEERGVKVEERDTIVVVGQRKAKRKRTGAAPAPKASSSSSSSPAKATDPTELIGEATKQEPKQESEPFDFNSVPNMLDDIDEAENQEAQRKKRKKEKGKGKVKSEGTGIGKSGEKGEKAKSLSKGPIDTSAFPKPPKAHSEVPGAGRSKTFR